MKFEQALAFQPRVEQKEEPRIHTLRFDDTHFGDTKIALGTLEFVAEFNPWWDNVCEENRLDPRNPFWEEVGYQIMELGKNAIEYGGVEGEIQIILEKDKVTAIVTDKGVGFENPNTEIVFNKPGHGLSEVKEYADEFSIETNGKKFTKTPNKPNLIRSKQTDVKEGTRITLVKKLGL